MKLYELTATSIPHPPCTSWRRGGRRVMNVGVKLRLKRERKGGECLFNSVFISHCPTPF